MLKPCGPLCVWNLGIDWIDRHTLALTRSPAPAAQHAAPPTQAAQAAAGAHAASAHGAGSRRRRRHRAAPAARTTLTPLELRLVSRLTAAGVTDGNEQAMFLAQVAHESGGFTRLRENLHYSAARLHQVFPRKFASEADAQAVIDQGEDAVAERIYGHRANLGNTEDGDGARFRGRGYIQLTGRANYQAAGQALGVDLVAQPDMAERPETAGQVAVWFWTRNASLRNHGAQGEVEQATRIVNGGVIGLADRRRRFADYQRLLRLHQEQQAGAVAPLP